MICLKHIDTNDAWIKERTGIEERRHVVKGSGETTTTMGVKAAQVAIERAGIDKQEIDFIVFATLSPDYYFPGPGVLGSKRFGYRYSGCFGCEKPMLWICICAICRRPICEVRDV